MPTSPPVAVRTLGKSRSLGAHLQHARGNCPLSITVYCSELSKVAARMGSPFRFLPACLAYTPATRTFGSRAVLQDQTPTRRVKVRFCVRKRAPDRDDHVPLGCVNNPSEAALECDRTQSKISCRVRRVVETETGGREVDDVRSCRMDRAAGHRRSSPRVS